MNACIVYKEEYDKGRPDATIKVVAAGTISAMCAEMVRIAETMKDDLASFIEEDGTLLECCRTVVEPEGLTYERYLLVG